MAERVSPHNVVFDNSGTLSESIKTSPSWVPAEEQLPSVPFVPETDARLAQVNVSITDANRIVFDTDRPLSNIVDEHDIDLFISLYNTSTDVREVRERLSADDSIPARTVHDHFESVRDIAERRHPEWFDSSDDSSPRGVQIVVDLDAGAVRKVIGYTAVPKVASYSVVESVTDAGHRPHIASGDAFAILRPVGDALAVPRENVYPFQTLDEKAETVRRLVSETNSPVVMVGDFVNDYGAFVAADVAILIENGSTEPETRERMRPVADHVVRRVDEIPELLDRVLD